MSRLADVLLQGTHAARPAASAGNTAYLYYETDTQTLFQSTGSAWTQIAAAATVVSGASYVPAVKTANYTILTTDSMIVAGASGLTFTLPAASAYTGKTPLIVKNDGFTTTTLARAGSDTIDGATSYALVAAYSSVSLVSDSSALWRVI